MIRSAAGSSRRGGRLISAAALGGVAAALSLAGAPGAVAANDHLQLSVDGQSYSSSVSGPVFEQGQRYVPGASNTATLWLRNNSGEPASLSSAAVIVRSDPELNGYMGFKAGLRPELSPRSPLGVQGTCTDVGQTIDLRPGEERQLTLVVDLAIEAPNATMNRTADVDLLFLLEPMVPGKKPRPACDALPGGDQDPITPGTTPGNTPVLTPDGTSGTDSDSTTGSVSPASGDAAVRPARFTPLPGAGTVPGAGSNLLRIAGTGAGAEAGTSRETGPAVSAQQPADIIPAGFQSTVEPIIRSLSGTLLIVMSVAFTAAVVLRIRNRQA
ncbi:hypothetical protein KKR91_05065 [Arthrobacter jiangjiafuii]|uniref:Uncharacterized protein n=1 Tax=Arthrobacter jiangjiafuii TaxID=2817475 RepID=A0A975M6T3_9MICC|nr:hypothetical protein [Arthrobacter jiangjiafuii]MBP3043977.1 hypothetical protein [Arthrobacter jiangjiafuii]QWC10972.1 hypothetical protein KKR91_05065 [Arthrobacter jiangjiafuii]